MGIISPRQATRIPLDASFQHRVIKAALNLLSNAKGPVLEDFLEDVPTIDEMSMTTCPVSFLKISLTLLESAISKVYALQPWYEMSLSVETIEPWLVSAICRQEKISSA